MLRLTDGPLAHWDVISSENKRNGRVEVIETVIRRMEEGMARWGIEVPSSDDEEEQRTQAALAFDDAEFQTGHARKRTRAEPARPARPTSDGEWWADLGAQHVSKRDLDDALPRGTAPVTASRSPSTASPLHDHKRWYARLRELGYTDLWSAEVDGSDGFTPLALAAAWEPTFKLGVAITPAYTRGPATLAQSVASIADAAPGHFAFGLGASSEVIVAGWNGLAFENQYTRVRDTLRFLRLALTGEKITQAYEGFSVTGFRLSRVPEQQPRPLRGRPATGHVASGGEGGRWRHPQLVEPRRCPDLRGRGRRSRRQGQGGRGPHLRDPLRGRRDGPGRGPPHDHGLS